MTKAVKLLLAGIVVCGLIAALLAVRNVVGPRTSGTRSEASARGAQEYSGQIGDLLITVTGAGPLPSGSEWEPSSRLRAGHRFVGVSVRIKNLATYANCTGLEAPQLKVDVGYVYQPVPSYRIHWLLAFGRRTYLREPDYHRLPPSAETEGVWTFEVKEGAKPVELVVYGGGEDMCREVQHRPGRITSPTTVTLSLQGLPGPVRPREE